MKKSLAMLWMTLAVAALAITGCHKSDSVGPVDVAPAGVTNEQLAIQAAATSDGFVQNDVVTFGDNELDPINYGNFGKVDASISPLRIGRFITSVTSNVTTTILPGDTLAMALIHKSFTGTFKIKGINGTGDTVTIQKAFTDTASRNIVFKRVGRDTMHYWRNWVPVASSLVDGHTVAPNNLINITMIQLFLANGDTVTVTDPSTYYLRYRWEFSLFGNAGWWRGGRHDVPEVSGGQPVRLQATVVSSSADTDVVALRFGFDLFHKKRVQLALVSETKNADNTFTRVYEISRTSPQYWHFHTGWFNLGVDAMTKGTVYDDAAPYSVSWWGIPYRVF